MRVPTPATRPLQVAVAVCAAVFTAGTALHNFAVVDRDLVTAMMAASGVADPDGRAAGFTTGFRIVGCLYVLGNAVGLLALSTPRAWVYWTVLAVNATQALGWVMIPPVMWPTVVDAHGPAGVLPAAVTDGGAAVLTLVLLAFLVRHRAPWAMRAR
ncbi:hypothetical protein [Actinorhabdospora filicis]|nr:hypothetical protein [Actinorhabdospora filicis]